MARPKLLLCILLMLTGFAVSAQDTPTLPTYATGETLVVVNTPRLNVRSLPSDTDPDSIIHTIIKRGERYPALAKTEDETWILIRISGDTAWVAANAVLITNPANIPIFGQVTPEQDAAMRELTAQLVAYINSTIWATDNLNIRLLPGTEYQLIGRIPFMDRAYPLYTNYNNTWYQVNYEGTVGWVSALYVRFPPTIVQPVYLGR